MLERAELPAILPLIRLLEPEIAVPELESRLMLMAQTDWYCLGAWQAGALVAVAGYSERVHLFSGRVLFVENVVVAPALRGARLGAALMAWLEQHAVARGCQKLTLDVYAVNQRAQQFYRGLGFDPRGVHFVKDLS